MRHAIACAHLHTCLNLLSCAFYHTLKTDMNPSRRVFFRSFECSITFLKINFLNYIVRKISFSFTCYSISLNQYICFSQEDRLQLIPLPDQKSITQQKNSHLTSINKIVSIRLTPKLFMSLSKVYVN